MPDFKLNLLSLLSLELFYSKKHTFLHKNLSVNIFKKKLCIMSTVYFWDLNNVLFFSQLKLDIETTVNPCLKYIGKVY